MNFHSDRKPWFELPAAVSSCNPEMLQEVLIVQIQQIVRVEIYGMVDMQQLAILVRSLGFLED